MPNEFDSVLLDGSTFPGVLERLLTGEPITDAEYRERCVETWKRRSPNVDVLSVEHDGDTMTVNYTMTPAPPFMRIDATFTVR